MMRPLLTPLVAQVAPTVDLDLTAEYLDPRITFTRAGTRTYFGADGLRKIAPANVWPRDYDPITLKCLGRTCWGANTNLIRQSNALGTTPWVNPSITVTPGTDIGADGALSLATVAVTAGGGRLTQPITISSGAIICVQVIAKRKNCDFLRLELSADNAGSGNRYTAWFNLVTGAVASSSASGWTVRSAEVQPLPNGLFLCSLVGATSGVTTAHVVARPAQADGGSAVAGDEVGLGDFQAEASISPQPYTPTTTTSLSRASETAAFADLSQIGFSAQAGTFVIDFNVLNLGSSSSVSVLSLGDGTSGGFVNVVVNDLRGFIQSVGGNPSGTYSNGQQGRACVTVEQVGANIVGRAWTNFPAGPTTATLTGRSLSSFTRIGIGGRSRGGGANDNQNGRPIQRVRYWPTILTDAESASFAG